MSINTFSELGQEADLNHYSSIVQKILQMGVLEDVVRLPTSFVANHCVSDYGKWF